MPLIPEEQHDRKRWPRLPIALLLGCTALVSILALVVMLTPWVLERFGFSVHFIPAW
jgi:hypothetical protein